MKKNALLWIHVYHKWESYDIWFLNYKLQQKSILSFWAIFYLFSPRTTCKIKILKFKKSPWDIIILHICTINDNHMLYGSWDMNLNRHNFFSFWTVFWPFTPLTTWKIKILKKWKKKTHTHKEILSFYTCVP